MASGGRRPVIRVLVVWAITSVALRLLGALLPGVEVVGWGAAFVAAALIGLLNALVWPLFVRKALPITVLTLGLAGLALNGLLIWAVDALVDGFIVGSLWWGIVLTAGLTAANTVATWFLAIDDDDFYYRNVVRRHARRTGYIRSDVPAVFFLEIDGLARDVLRRAIRDGNAPTMARWIREGTHRLIEWECDWSSQTGADADVPLRPRAERGQPSRGARRWTGRAARLAPPLDGRARARGVPRRRRLALRLSWIGHSTVLVESEGTRILTDPLLATGSRTSVVYSPSALLPRTSTRSSSRTPTTTIWTSPHCDGLAQRPAWSSRAESARPCGDAASRTSSRSSRGRRSRSAWPPLGRRPPSTHVYAEGANRSLALGYVVGASAKVYFAGDTDLFATDGQAASDRRCAPAGLGLGTAARRRPPRPAARGREPDASPTRDSRFRSTGEPTSGLQAHRVVLARAGAPFPRGSGEVGARRGRAGPGPR
jgi:uncharacterized membrane protein YvlD (DUF360 family)